MVQNRSSFRSDIIRHGPDGRLILVDGAEAAAEREKDALSEPETKLPTTEGGRMMAGKLNPPEHIPMS